MNLVLAAVSAFVLVITSALMLAFGVALVFMIWRAGRMPRRGAMPAPADSGVRVCVQVPVYNERFVVERVIDAVAALTWTNLEIQILDDSDDDTSAIAARQVAMWQQRGVAITHIRRNVRHGYKAGALAHGMALTTAPFFAVFDADFQPPPLFLQLTMGAFDIPRVGFVQARWTHTNADVSWLTRLQGVAVDFHFLVEQAVRSTGGFFTNFTGTAGVWRRAAIEDAGGWRAVTLTEDLDLSYRAQLRGWQAWYLETVEVPEQLPTGIAAYRRQQARWATGSFQCAWRLLPSVLRSDFDAPVRAMAVAHLLSYGIPVLMLVQLLCFPVLLIAQVEHPLVVPWLRAVGVLNLISLAPSGGIAVAQWRAGRSPWRGVMGIGCQVLGAGMALTVAVALTRSFRAGGEFVRTPKQATHASAALEGGYSSRGSAFALAESLSGAIALGVAVLAWETGFWPTALYAAVMATGLLALAGAGLGELFTDRVLVLSRRRAA